MSTSAVARRDTGIIEVVPIGSSGVATVGDQWDNTRREFIRKTYCGGAPDDMAATFLYLCERRHLSPEARHVYLINRAGEGKPANWVIQTGIDGYRLIADRTQLYAGSDEPVYVHDPDGNVAIASVTVRKVVAGLIGSFTASARWDEYAAKSPMWTKMPHTMLAKCAEALALRKAFPEELSGFYTDVEVDQAEYDRAIPSAPPRVSQPAARAAVSASSNEGAMKALHAEAAKHEVTHEQLHELGVAIYGVESLTACEVQQLTAMRLAVRDCKPDDFNALMQLATVVPTTDDRAYLDDILGEAEKGKLPENARRLLAAAADRVAKTLPAVAS